METVRESSNMNGTRTNPSAVEKGDQEGTNSKGAPNMDMHAEDPSAVSRSFTIGFTLVQLLGLICISLVATWTGKHLGGFAWTSSPKHEFNYHPLLMVIGMVFLYGDAIMVFRVLRYERKKILKYIHAGLHLCIIILVVIGLKAVFDFHNLNNPPFKNLYSLHSWIGLSTVILFCLQYAVGFVAFLFPGASRLYRIILKPYHVFFGLALFILAICTCLTGITEKLIFIKNYDSLGETQVIGNILGVFLVLLGIFVVFLVASPKFQRQPLPEEEVLQMERHSSVN